MIFADKFEAVPDVLQACVFLGAQLFVNGHHQGVIEAEKMNRGDVYEVIVSGQSWAQLNGWACGYRNGSRFVDLGATLDYIAVIEGQELGTINLQATKPTDYCGNPRDSKGVYCPGG